MLPRLQRLEQALSFLAPSSPAVSNSGRDATFLDRLSAVEQRLASHLSSDASAAATIKRTVGLSSEAVALRLLPSGFSLASTSPSARATAALPAADSSSPLDIDVAVALLKESVPRVEALSRHLSSLASCLPDALLEETSLGCGYGATAAVRARVAALSEAIEARAAEAALIRAETMDVADSLSEYVRLASLFSNALKQGASQQNAPAAPSTQPSPP